MTTRKCGVAIAAIACISTHALWMSSGLSSVLSVIDDNKKNLTVFAVVARDDVKNLSSDVPSSSIPPLFGLLSNQSIAYRLVPYRSFQDERQYSCDDTKQHNPLPLDLQPLFNFSVEIATNLSILLVGDSVGMQMGKYLIASTVQEKHDSSNRKNSNNSSTTKNKNKHYTTLRELETKQWKAEGLIAATGLVGGGSIGVWRMLNLFRKKFENGPLPNGGPGWSRLWAYDYMQYATSDHGRQRRLPPSFESHNGSAVDVVIQRVSHPWTKFEEVTDATLSNAVGTAQWFTGCQVVIFVTSPFNSNVESLADIAQLKAMNGRIKKFTRDYKQRQLVKVLYADLASFMDEFLQYQGKRFGYNTTSGEDYKLVRAAMTKKGKHGSTSSHAMKVVHACDEVPANNNSVILKPCKRNSVSVDGLHLCMNTVGPRLNAAFACLVSCAYDHSSANDGLMREYMLMRDCERECNEKWMSLRRPIESVSP